MCVPLRFHVNTMPGEPVVDHFIRVKILDHSFDRPAACLAKKRVAILRWEGQREGFRELVEGGWVVNEPVLITQQGTSLIVNEALTVEGGSRHRIQSRLEISEYM